MLFMNEFLQQHWDGMRLFLQTVSSLDSDIPTTSFDGYVDLPLRLAVLHGLLVDIIYQRDQVGQQVVTCFHGGDLCLFMVVFMALKACWVGLWSLKGSEFACIEFGSPTYHPRLLSNKEWLSIVFFSGYSGQAPPSAFNIEPDYRLPGP